jgi:CPA2 family monovalent cation:H+ antiporter-2
MAETHGLLRELLLLAGLTLAISLVFGRIRVPAVTGFIVAGVVIGPGGLGLIRDPGTIHVLAEIGVVLLLFTVGLEFSLADLRELGFRTMLAGVLQIALTAALVAPCLVLAGLHPAQAVFLGLAAAISSTTILLKVISERGELRAPHGRLTLGFSIVQDLSLVPLTLLLPVLAGWAQGGHTTRFGVDGALHALWITAASALFLYTAWKWLPWLLGRAARTRSREVFLAAIVFVVLGSAYLSDRAGLSLAVGAFLGGLMIAGSEVSSQAAADLMPFRDTLSSVFFLSIGLLFSPGALAQYALPALALTAVVIVLKLVAATVASRLARVPWAVAFATGIAVAHVGEFAFVLARLGEGAGLLPAAWLQVFVASSVLSMLIAPFLVNAAPGWAVALESRRARTPAADAEAVLAPPALNPARQNHVIIAGFGLNGANVARVLRAVRIPHVVVDQAPDKIAACVAQGSEGLLGNAVQPEILERAGVAHARALVLALSDPVGTRHATRIARQHHRGLFIVVRRGRCARWTGSTRWGRTWSSPRSSRRRSRSSSPCCVSSTCRRTSSRRRCCCSAASATRSCAASGYRAP